MPLLIAPNEVSIATQMWRGATSFAQSAKLSEFVSLGSQNGNDSYLAEMPKSNQPLLKINPI